MNLLLMFMIIILSFQKVNNKPEMVPRQNKENCTYDWKLIDFKS